MKIVCEGSQDDGCSQQSIRSPTTTPKRGRSKKSRTDEEETADEEGPQKLQQAPTATSKSGGGKKGAPKEDKGAKHKDKKAKIDEVCF